MIHFFIGTKAQFIKMVPVMVELKNRGIAFRYVDSGQHAELTKTLRRSFGMDEPDVCLHTKGDVTSIAVAVGWTCRLGLLCLRGKWLLQNIFPGGGICLIHGDTLSTLLGMRMAKAAGLKVGHVEAGLRSFNIWHPFPEEIIRIHCMKRCDVLFAPSEEAVRNLQNMKVAGRVIGVGGNTVVDALRLAETAEMTVEIPDEPFALAACHRLETITNKRRLAKVVDLLRSVSEKIGVVFVIHKPTRKYLNKFGLMDRLGQGVTLLGMQDYVNFTALMRAAKMVLADGGSIQEECAYLNKPCLILRNKTERPDGLGRNAVLWNFDDSVAQDFLVRAEALCSPETPDWPRPSAEIVEALIEYAGVES
jgi:UDP-N-acetylglucosamine 2-epimerase